MAPVLSGVWWGPEAGVVGSGAAAAATGVASLLGGGQLVLAVGLSGLTALLLVSVLLLLCASCQGQKKAANEHPAGDHENLMNGVSEKDTVSQSADSPATEMAVSSSHNGPLTSGTILSDTQDSSPQPSEDMLSSQSELRSSKCPQDRELPSIPPSNALMGDGPPPSGESTYEVVKEIAAASRDLSAEDSLYETVKELKDPPSTPATGLPNGTAQPSPDEPPPHPPHPPNHHHSLVNGHLSPGTPERGPLCVGVEYASIDLNKKSRHSADLEAKRRSANAIATAAAAAPQRRPLEEPEEEVPPPVPEKVLDENDNQPVLINGLVGAGLHNGELHSPLSPPAPGFDSHLHADKEAAVYSTVDRANGDDSVNEDDREHDYSSIAELKGLVPASSSSDLYATVRDIYAQPDEGRGGGDELAPEGADPGYETIRIPKQTSSSSDEERRGGAGPEGDGGEGPDGGKAEPDYESVGELGLSRETSRL